MIVDTLDKLYQKGLSRRNFMVAAGAAGAAAALSGCNDNFTASTAPTTTATGLTDTDILTFALNLEYLEAQFYLYAATGAGLAPADTTGGSSSAFGTAAGATIVPTTTKLTGLTPLQQNFVNELAYTEQTHVRLLRSALGAAAPPMPAIDLTFFAPAYVAAQTLAKVATPVTNFSPFTSYDNYLVGGFIFEDVGVTAYNGAAPLISAAGVAAGYLATAAGIMAVEAYHAAALRTQITANAIAAETITPGNAAATPPTNATTTTTYSQFLSANLISALRASLGGGGETPLTLPNTQIASSAATAPVASPTVPAPVYASSLVAANSSALAYARSTDQVHHIVYGSATVGVGKGGFFPNGTNFRFSTTVS